MTQKVKVEDVLNIIEKVSGAVGGIIGSSLPILRQLDKDLVELDKSKSKSKKKSKKKSH